MKLEKLIGRCIDALQESANEDWYPEWDRHDTLGAHVPTENGEIDLFYYWDKKTHFWECEVVVYHDNNENESSNLEKFLSKELAECVEWEICEDEWKEACEDEWQAHGFRDEADFWHWKEGR